MEFVILESVVEHKHAEAKYEDFHIKRHNLENTEMYCSIPHLKFLTLPPRKLQVQVSAVLVHLFYMKTNREEKFVKPTRWHSCFPGKEVISDHEKNLRKGTEICFFWKNT